MLREVEGLVHYLDGIAFGQRVVCAREDIGDCELLGDFGD